jgi:hypothetical protein
VLVEPAVADDEAVGVDGSGFEGFTVAVDRALSVLELVIELKRELGSFLVMVKGSPPLASACDSQTLSRCSSTLLSMRGLARVQVMARTRRRVIERVREAGRGCVKPLYGGEERMAWWTI